MDTEIQQFRHIKKYLEKLGYPPKSIFFEYSTMSGRHIDLVVKVGDEILVVIEVKNQKALNIQTLDEIEYHPISRKLQKEAQELKAKFYILSNGKENLWMQTGEGGRPEKIAEVNYSSFNLNTLSESQYINDILNHVVEFLRNFPITGDHLFDTSIVFYTKLSKETKHGINLTEFINDLFSKHHFFEKLNSKYSPKDILLESLVRLESLNFRKHKLTIIDFIDTFFENNRREWNVPRWLGDFMVKILDCKIEDYVIDLFAKNGVVTSAAYLNNIKNLTSYYSNKNELYWIKIQQLLILGEENTLKFEPELLNGDADFLSENSVNGILMVPPFNLKFQNNPQNILYNSGIKDSTSFFLEVATKTIIPDGKVVAIVSDNFLISDQYLKARKYFLKHNTIDSIISLPSDTFKPFSGVKTSVISFIKKASVENPRSFLASIESTPERKINDCTKSTELNGIIQNYYSYLNNNEFIATKSGFVVDKLDAKNLHFSKYWFENRYDNHENLQEGFLSVPLKELVFEIVRGGALVNDSENGDVPYISPASIRSMRLINEELSYTTKDKIPARTTNVEIGDIVINTIGSHRGNAAIVTSEFDGIAFNRHIIALRANYNLILPEYLTISLNSKFVQEQFFDRSTGTVIPALNLRSFEEIIIPVPNLDVQNKITLEFNSLTSKYNLAYQNLAAIQNELNNKLNNLGREVVNS